MDRKNNTLYNRNKILKGVFNMTKELIHYIHDQNHIISEMYQLAEGILIHSGDYDYILAQIMDGFKQVYDMKIIEEYPAYQYLLEEVDHTKDVLDHFEEQFKDIDQKLKELDKRFTELRKKGELES